MKIYKLDLYRLKKGDCHVKLTTDPTKVEEYYMLEPNEYEITDEEYKFLKRIEMID